MFLLIDVHLENRILSHNFFIDFSCLKHVVIDTAAGVCGAKKTLGCGHFADWKAPKVILPTRKKFWKSKR